MEAIILLCLLGLVIIAGITWFVIASRRGTRYQHKDQFVSRVPTDPIDRLLHPTNDPTNTDTGYPFPKNPYGLPHPGRDDNEASYRGTEYRKEENLGDLPWD